MTKHKIHLLSRSDLAQGTVRRINVTKFSDPAFVLSETSPSAVAVYASCRAVGKSAADSFMSAFSGFFISEEGCFVIGFADAAREYEAGLNSAAEQTPDTQPATRPKAAATVQTTVTPDLFATPV